MNNINKKIDVDWIVHCVIDDKKKEVAFHTHGIDKHGYRELSIEMNLPQEIGQELINIAAIKLLRKDKDYMDMDYDDKICNARVYFMVATDKNDESKEVTRLIFPDQNGKYPWDADVEEYCKRQLDRVISKNIS